MTRVSVSAPGKVNIFFAVGPLRPDGYHEVLSIYQALDLREVVTVSSAEEWQVAVSGEISKEQIESVPTGESNLVVRAARILAIAAGIETPHPVKFEISKSVPVAGGMGGGSADAAAALVAVNELWCTGISEQKILEAAAELGADVPFALLGGTALGSGAGERLQSVSDVQTLHWVLVTCDGGLSTPAVYQRLDELRLARGVDPVEVAIPETPNELIEALVAGDLTKISGLLRNDLQEAAVDLMPELEQTMQAGLAAGAVAAMVSGSGPTVALLAADESAAQSIANQLAIQGHTAIPTHGPAAGTITETN